MKCKLRLEELRPICTPSGFGGVEPPPVVPVPDPVVTAPVPSPAPEPAPEPGTGTVVGGGIG